MSAYKRFLETLLNKWPWMQDWRNPDYVWRFQQTFGVQRVRVDTVTPGQPYKPKDYDEYVQRQKKKKLQLNSRESGNKKGLGGQFLANQILVSSSGYSSAGNAADEDETTENTIFYRINNLFWYYVFFLGTQLGDETYYSIFFCFWFWNIDQFVGRKVMLVWNVVMYIGQGMKDVIRWPRPAMPPAIQLESKWSLEYGMPSTHAMVGLAVPTSILFATIGRYPYPFFAWAVVAFVWCTLVCTSRLYLGVHSLADIFVGLAFGALLLIPIFFYLDDIDHFLVYNPLAPLFSISVTLLACYYYPGSDRWSPARGDTTIILGVYLGVQLGVWTLVHLGNLRRPSSPPPYPILWPTYAQYGQTIVRLIVGAVVFVATKAIFKPIAYFSACYLLNEDVNKLKKQDFDIKNKNKIIVELTQKFVSFLFVGFNTITVTPMVFRVMGIERLTYFTEL